MFNNCISSKQKEPIQLNNGKLGIRVFFSILLILCFIASNSIAQKEGNIWYFGDHAGLDFNSGVPVPINNSAMYQREGCAVISDSDGQLLFYTNGQLVWNRIGKPMNEGLLLQGGQSSTQSAIIAKKPGNNTLYYVFTVPDGIGDIGLRYTIIDMSLNNGYGDFLFAGTTTLNAGPTEEKVTAVAHENGTDIWIITHLWDSDAFYAFLLTENGIDKNQVVISNTGLFHQGAALSAGYMKASPDGSKLAIITRINNSFQLFDFNSQSGIISNPVTFPSQYPLGYGIEFSPKGDMLYISDYSATKSITQFDLTLPVNEIVNSGIIIGAVSNTFIGALQIAPDGKIYVSKFDHSSSNPYYGDKFLGAITFPEKRGLDCLFVEDDLYLGDGACFYGLPTFVQSYFFKLQNFTADNICSGDTTYFSISNDEELIGVLWDFGDPASGTLNQDTSINSIHVYNTSGEYEVQLISYFNTNVNTITKTIIINPSPEVNLGIDRNICSIYENILFAGNGNNSYIWQDGSSDSTFSPISSGDYNVTATNSFGCTSSDSVTLTMIESPEINLGNDTILNVGETITLQVSSGYSEYYWNTGSSNNYLFIDTPGEYWIEVENSGCFASDSIKIIFESHCRIYCPTAFTPNGDGSNDTFTPMSNEDLSKFHLMIFSKWGTNIFESFDLTNTWDGMYNGNMVEIGAYVWVIEYQGLYSIENKAYKGTVVVLR